MTDERALQIYAESYGAALSWHRKEEWPEIANEVRAVLSAPSLDAAMAVIAYWSYGEEEAETNTRLTKAMREKYDAEGNVKESQTAERSRLVDLVERLANVKRDYGTASADDVHRAYQHAMTEWIASVVGDADWEGTP